jgi:DNA-binding response OmpR family regulator
MSRSVLVAEDDGGIRQLLTTILTLKGFDVVPAVDGLDAIEKLRARPFDCVIVDLMMPRLSGYVVVRFLEEKYPDNHCVIVISAVRKDELDDIARSRVVRRVFQKPFDVNEVTAEVKEAVCA